MADQSNAPGEKESKEKTAQAVIHLREREVWVVFNLRQVYNKSKKEHKRYRIELIVDEETYQVENIFELNPASVPA